MDGDELFKIAHVEIVRDFRIREAECARSFSEAEEFSDREKNVVEVR